MDDAIKAYKNTRNTQFESRSLIVRFRRINGNVGVPGENKQQSNVATAATPKPKTESQPTTSNSACSSPAINTKSNDSISDGMVDKQNVRSTLQNVHVPDLNLVKDEPLSDNEDSFDVKPDLVVTNTNGFDSTLIKREIKNEPLEAGFENGPFLANEDEVEHEEHEEYINDTYQFMEGNFLHSIFFLKLFNTYKYDHIYVLSNL